jgi:hypothetical protein
VRRSIALTEQADCRDRAEDEVALHINRPRHPEVVHSIKVLRRAAPCLRLNLPDAIAVRERVRKGTGPYDGLAFNRHSESP